MGTLEHSWLEHGWLALGLLGQAVFSARFLLQWVYSEYKRESVMPLAFWYMSIVGGAMLLCYALYKHDPVFIAGQSCGVFIYARNLQLRLRELAATQGGESQP
ncbi:MAG TPA: lipid-A-disaccharide synthase N-terminal domain-containing protein [Dyella sp.]|uniref:lipid-A-disaccharide synthase N-terminal domain-containing protein n=1 Tax=Dyella sp. TaxID=1869338 RepID=UPI002CAEBC85|nr:lipid-A-disaccharide synthase N-terminal domain-containing protein [Dyella sp.]HTV84844.1 lipid-A-disaccharide synthase N-terminal domain-containing protein [Dyella sp.]